MSRSSGAYAELTHCSIGGSAAIPQPNAAVLFQQIVDDVQLGTTCDPTPVLSMLPETLFHMSATR